MSRYHAYLQSAAGLVKAYDGKMPLSHYLKQFFATHKKFGSTDRKQVAALCYQYYRAGKLTTNLSAEDGILLSAFLCNNSTLPILELLRPGWSGFMEKDIAGKLAIAGLKWEADRHSPWLHLVQPEINAGAYALSHFTQPDLFIRIRPGKGKTVREKIIQAGIAFGEESADCLRLPNGSKVEQWITLNREAVVQDKSSQQCGAVIKKVFPEFSGLVWDACAASGGKSILMHDLYPGKIRLAVSDIRQSILSNLTARFKVAGISVYHLFEADLSENAGLKNVHFKPDMILVDAPCTGSGTWARTPEQHYFFDPATVNAFAEKQFAICRNTSRLLGSSGLFVYMTCSVFEKENSEVSNRISTELKLEKLHSEIIDGTLGKADSMYIALFRKP